MVPKRLGFMIFLWVQAAASRSVIGIIGSTVELRCYELNDTFILNNLIVTWQIEGETSCFIDTYNPDEEDLTSYRMKYQCEDFRERTDLLNEELKQGKFTLQLLRVSPKDEFTYTCVVLKRDNEGKFYVHTKVKTNLTVAANYSMPVLSHVSSGDEMTFICTSSHGYPQPKVYWVNHTDISLLNSTQQYTRAPNGTISVFSSLTVKAATDIKLECTIENEPLKQNLTATIDMSSPENSPSVNNSPIKTKGAVLGSAAAVAVVIGTLLILYIAWKKRKTSVLMTYTAPAEMGNTDFGRPE